MLHKSAIISLQFDHAFLTMLQCMICRLTHIHRDNLPESLLRVSGDRQWLKNNQLPTHNLRIRYKQDRLFLQVCFLVLSLSIDIRKQIYYKYFIFQRTFV